MNSINLKILQLRDLNLILIKTERNKRISKIAQNAFTEGISNKGMILDQH